MKKVTARVLISLAITLVVSSGAFWSGYSKMRAPNGPVKRSYGINASPATLYEVRTAYKGKNFNYILYTTLVFGIVVFFVMLGVLKGLEREHPAWSIVTILLISVAAVVVGGLMTLLHAYPPSNM